jgi:hypothetical protein
MRQPRPAMPRVKSGWVSSAAMPGVHINQAE